MRYSIIYASFTWEKKKHTHHFLEQEKTDVAKIAEINPT